jgi:NAD(P)-dependent dehydrogenase (short-subunit alcohol dehydrogenase family)
VVTGGNSGTGYATCKAFYERGATVYMASRSADRAQEAIAKIQSGYDSGMNNSFVQGPKSDKAASGKLIFLRVDLADLGSVEEMVQECFVCKCWCYGYVSRDRQER